MRTICHLHLTRFVRMLLDRKDRVSMAVGLEVRVPFCDHRLVEYVYNTPWALKTFDGREKSLLRHAAAHVAAGVGARTRVKSPYPSTQDPAYAAALQQQAKEVLADPDHPVFALVDRAWLTGCRQRTRPRCPAARGGHRPGAGPVPLVRDVLPAARNLLTSSALEVGRWGHEGAAVRPQPGHGLEGDGGAVRGRSRRGRRRFGGSGVDPAGRRGRLVLGAGVVGPLRERVTAAALRHGVVWVQGPHIVPERDALEYVRTEILPKLRSAQR